VALEGGMILRYSLYQIIVLLAQELAVKNEEEYEQE